VRGAPQVEVVWRQCAKMVPAVRSRQSQSNVAAEVVGAPGQANGAVACRVTRAWHACVVRGRDDIACSSTGRVSVRAERLRVAR